MIASVAGAESAPIIGNGDILTHYEAQQRAADYGTHALMVGRGALIRPWIFQEFKEGRELHLSAADRVGVYRQLVSYMKAHFGDDAFGKRKAWYFFPWHFAFFHRYRDLPQAVYGPLAAQHPLILTRMDLFDERLGETLDGLPLLERLLRAENEKAHEAIANILWDAASDAEALAQLEALGREQVVAWEEEARAGGDRDRDASRGGGVAGGGEGGRGGERGRKGRNAADIERG